MNCMLRRCQGKMGCLCSSCKRKPPTLSSNSNTSRPTFVNKASNRSRNPPGPGLQHLIKKFKSQIRSHGGNGFLGLQRRFKIISDDDGNNTISLGEFKKAMKDLKIQIDEKELRILFGYFDEDNSGEIDFEEFISGLRDPLNSRRLELVQMAWNKLDRDNSGTVDVTEIAAMYDASKHPDVIAGKVAPQKVYRDFLVVFEGNGNSDGSLTKQEFEDYYTNLGANIDDDDYFELMIRNSWHISGGTGWSANTANKRVLVTRKDGRESVEEIQNDLGLRAGDKAGMSNRLRAQGVDMRDVGDVGTSYGNEDKNDGKLRERNSSKKGYMSDFFSGRGEAPKTASRAHSNKTKSKEGLISDGRADSSHWQTINSGGIPAGGIKPKQQAKRLIGSSQGSRNPVTWADAGGGGQRGGGERGPEVDEDCEDQDQEDGGYDFVKEDYIRKNVAQRRIVNNIYGYEAADLANERDFLNDVNKAIPRRKTGVAALMCDRASDSSQYSNERDNQAEIKKATPRRKTGVAALMCDRASDVSEYSDLGL